MRRAVILGILACAAWAMCKAPATAAILGLTRIATGLSQPMYVTHAPGDTSRLFIVQKGGTIRVLDTNTQAISTYLTISDADTAGDGGVQSMAFHPDFANNGRFYIHVTVDNGGVSIDGVTSPFSSHIREYTDSGGPIAATQVDLFSWVQPRSNHNGGWIGFSPTDGYLYVMSGDGGKQGDPDNNAQTLDDPLGNVFRVDVNQAGTFSIPGTNPFVGGSAADDMMWAYGLRNPWRASFDRATGDLYIGDVGQNSFEEIDFQSAASLGGENYAWNRREGFSAYQGGALLPGDTEPIYDYGHGGGTFQGNSVVGGYVYRGPDPDLQGMYFFADTISGHVWMFDPSDPAGTIQNVDSLLTPDVGALNTMVSFGEDTLGNLYLVDFQGDVFLLETTVLPEPSAFALGSLALAALAIFIWRRRKTST